MLKPFVLPFTNPWKIETWICHDRKRWTVFSATDCCVWFVEFLNFTWNTTSTQADPTRDQWSWGHDCRKAHILELDSASLSWCIEFSLRLWSLGIDSKLQSQKTICPQNHNETETSVTYRWERNILISPVRTFLFKKDMKRNVTSVVPLLMWETWHVVHSCT